MQAVLLAGGLGTRLKSVVNDRPKPMALIEGIPFMEYVVRELAANNIDHIIFAVGYKGSMVEDYFGDGKAFSSTRSYDVKLDYAYEKELLGTAGAIKNAGKYIDDDRFFVLNADTLYRIDFSRMITLSDSLKLDMALVLREVTDISRYGEAVISDTGILKGFNEKTAESRKGTINGGIYLMKKALLSEIPEGKVSLENDMIPRWLIEKKALGGIVNDGYFIDIGVPEDYYRFADDVKKGVIKW